MEPKGKKTVFGQLLQRYREENGVSQLELERLLRKVSYPITNGMVNRYENGKRRPPAAFVSAVALCLSLSGNERDALIDAHLSDQAVSFFEDYNNPTNKNETSSKTTKQKRILPAKRSSSSPKKPKIKRLLKVFLCHSSGDKPTVRNLYYELQKDGFDPWLDEEELYGGEDWDSKIQKAVHSSDVVIVCLSQSSITKTGYVQKEIKIALDAADMRPEDTIFIIPLKLEECNIPNRLKRWQWVELFDERGYERLRKSLLRRASDLSI